MSLKIVVLAKQVPDTRNVGKDAMNADGTINRAALPAIFNPEDLNALDRRRLQGHPGGPQRPPRPLQGKHRRDFERTLRLQAGKALHREQGVRHRGGGVHRGQR